MNCPSCNHENPDRAKFCLECGAAFALRCASCGTELPAGAKFCLECGAATSPTERAPRDYTPKHLADKILQSKSALEGERKRVTVLFADVKGSMELSEELDPEAWHRILDRFFEILTEGVHRFEGTVNQYTGDGIMALFGAPIAHEDHAHRACYAALHLRDAVRAYANEVRVEHGVAFGARIGLNSGDVVVGKIGDDLRMDYTAQGHTVGLAQRMEALADAGRICLSEHTAGLVEGYFQMADLGRASVKGVSEPVGLFELEGTGPFRTRLDVSRARGLSTFVGRDAEVATLEAALESALAGQARIAGVVAGAGVGKSRLCYEFAERCRAKGIMVAEAHCPVHGKTIPLLPIRELLRGYFGVSDADSARGVREKLAGRLLLLDRAFEADLPAIWDFMGVPDPDRPADVLEPEALQSWLFDFTRRLVRARSEQEPAVLLLDDLHWIDPQSDAVVAQLADAIRGTRTLLLTNFRPEYRADWMQRADYQQLPLAPLGPDAIQALLAALLGSDDSVSGLPPAIAARTEGNPFFTEEVVQGLIDAGRLVGERGSYRLEGSLEALDIPPSVHAVLAARIDRLAERDKRVLQTAAVIGRNFAQKLLAQVSDEAEPALAESLRALANAEFVYERSLYPEVEYTFKHPLTHEVAYGSLLAERRRGIHARLARALEAQDAAAATLAYHYDEADEPEPAARWHRAAAEGTGFFDSTELLHHWQRVIDLAARLPETPEHLSLGATARAQLLYSRTRLGAEPDWAATMYDEACELGRRAGDPAPVARAQSAYAIYSLYAGQPGAAEIAEQAVVDSDATGDPDLRVGSRFSATICHWFVEDLEKAALRSGEALELCGDDLERGLGVTGYCPWIFLRGMRAGNLARLGHAREATRLIEEIADDFGEKHAQTQALACTFGVRVNELTGDLRAALAWGRRSVEGLEAAHATTPAAEIFAYSQLGIAQVLNADYAGALASLERSLNTSRERNVFLMQRPEILAFMAQAHCGLGDGDRALALLSEAFEKSAEMELTIPLVGCHLTRARVLRAFEPERRDAIREDLDAAERAAERCSMRLALPQIHIERAELSDADTRRRELEAALALYREMEAGPNAARVEELLGK